MMTDTTVTNPNLQGTNESDGSLPSKRSKTISSAANISASSCTTTTAALATATATTTGTTSTSTTTSISSSSTSRIAVRNLTSILQEAARGGDNENDDEADVEVVNVDNEPSLVPPGPNCTASCWEYFMKFDPNDHPDLKEYSYCVLCTTKISRGPDNSTGGMKRHLQFKHFDEYCFVVQKEITAKEDAASKEANKDSKAKITSHFRAKDKFTDAEAKQLYLVASSTCAATHGLPLSLFEKAAFRKMFMAVNKAAGKIVNINAQSLRTEILTLGMMASEATRRELVGKHVSYTSDHWTGPNDETYTTVTAHYISEDWVMRSVCIDFKVFQGRTTGENIYDDIMTVLARFVSEGQAPDFVQDTIGITDTTGNMGKLGKFLRDNGHEHAYCTDHVFHLTAILAFSGKLLLQYLHCASLLPVSFYIDCSSSLTNVVSVLLFTTPHLHSLLLAKGVPGVAVAMGKLRAMIGYFEHSTQAMAKLLHAQATSDSPEYKGKRPRKLLQDVVTRWWSTFRAIRQARFLRRIIQSLHALGTIDCEVPTDAEWTILHQTEIALETMASFQETLEGEKYVTSSLVPIAVFQVRKHFMAVTQNSETVEPVKALTVKLLDDFDKRYVPTADDGGSKLGFKWGASVGRCNRYNTVHHYFFVAAYLDPRVKSLLKKKFMIKADYKILRQEIRKLMITKETKRRELEGLAMDESETQEATTSLEPGEAPTTAASEKRAAMFDGLADDEDGDNSDDDDEEETGEIVLVAATTTKKTIHQTVDKELAKYDKVQALPLYNPDGSYVNPLDWWKKHAASFELLAALAFVYLAIPATSAPSERIWSRAAIILTCKRSKLKPEVAQSMMLLKENAHLVRIHYSQIAPAYRNKDLQHLVSIELDFLPEISDVIGEEDDDNLYQGEMDVGQHDGDTFSLSNTRRAG